ncbi:MAG: hypothetical protein R3286_16650 [Gammaproteobacteria bacterium]|nr:hypothetical protein [Gammaproteobacteria bacterium]
MPRACIVLAAALAALPPLAAAPRCDYDVSVRPTLSLDVAVRCDADVRALIPAGHAARRHVDGYALTRGDAGVSAAYRVDLAAMARDEANLESALVSGDSLLAVGSAWLLAPERAGGASGTLRVRVDTARGVDFATAQPDVDGRFEIADADLVQSGFSAFGRFDRLTLQAPGRGAAPADFEVVILDGALDLDRDVLVAWIDDSARALAEFWGGFPAPGMTIFVLPRAASGGVPFGRVMSGGGVSMVLVVGEHATRAELYDDWVLVHELVHVGTPFVRGAFWLSEGLATYFEPLIRARWGRQRDTDMWHEFAREMPRGAAVLGGSGLAAGGFRGWYWGGALLFLLADVELRRGSDGRLGLEDCLRDVHRRVGNYAARMHAAELAAACDALAGRAVLAPLMRRHAYAANAVDLDALWRELGVVATDGGVRLDDDAPLAWVRRAIVAGDGETRRSE